MTLVLRARCSDGVVMMTDMKITKLYSAKAEYRSKISAVFTNHVFGYAGDQDVNDVFVKYAIGDLIVLRDDSNRYTKENLIEKLRANMDRFRKILATNQ